MLSDTGSSVYTAVSKPDTMTPRVRSRCTASMQPICSHFAILMAARIRSRRRYLYIVARRDLRVAGYLDIARYGN